MMQFFLLAVAAVKLSVAAAAPSACVTGASGFVGTELVYQLLELGWEVHGTVRNLTKTEKYDSLNKIAEKFADKGGKLELHQADLLIPGSFDECVIGRDYVFHPATIFSFGEADPYSYHEAAVQGSKNVLDSVLKAKDTAKPVKKTVVTMSVFSIYNFCGSALKCPKTQKPLNGEYFNENDWSHTLVPDGGYAYTSQPLEAYGRSKVDQDKFTREFCQIHDLECATVHPAFIVGPPRGRVSGVSLNVLAGISKGAQWLNFHVGDNRDVAETHIKAAITPGATGRYIVSTFEQLSDSELAYCLKDRFSGITLAKYDRNHARPNLKFSAKLTEELLGRQLRDQCVAYGDAIEGFYEAGLTQNPGLHSEL